MDNQPENRCILSLITPRACARGKSIRSVRLLLSLSSQKRIFQDLQLQKSRERLLKSAKNYVYVLVPASHRPRVRHRDLYATPIRHTYGGYSIMHYDCACPKSFPSLRVGSGDETTHAICQSSV